MVSTMASKTSTLQKLDLANSSQNKLLAVDSSSHAPEESFDLTWNDILYEGGSATLTTRSSIRWLTVTVCLIGILGKWSG